MTEYEIEFLTYNDSTEYALSANTDAGQFLMAMKNRDESPEFFVGVSVIKMPDDMAEWEANLLYGGLDASRIVIDEILRIVTVHTLISTRDIRSFQVTINDSDNDW